MTNKEKLLEQGININALVPVEVPSSSAKVRTTGAFKEREQYWTPRWSWNKANNKA